MLGIQGKHGTKTRRALEEIISHAVCVWVCDSLHHIILLFDLSSLIVKVLIDILTHPSSVMTCLSVTIPHQTAIINFINWCCTTKDYAPLQNVLLYS